MVLHGTSKKLIKIGLYKVNSIYHYFDILHKNKKIYINKIELYFHLLYETQIKIVLFNA